MDLTKLSEENLKATPHSRLIANNLLRQVESRGLNHSQHYLICVFFNPRPSIFDFSVRIDGVPDAAPQAQTARSQRLMKRTLTSRIQWIGATHQQIAQPDDIGGTERIPPVHVPIFIACVVEAVVREFFQLAVAAHVTRRYEIVTEREDMPRRTVRDIFNRQVEQRPHRRTAAHQTTGLCKIRHGTSQRAR